MKKFLGVAALLLMGVSTNSQAMDWGFQGGLSGAFAIIGDYHLDSKSSIRGFYNSDTISGVGVSSIGAAYEYDFRPHIYGGLGLQLVRLTGVLSSWNSGVASYLAVGYKDRISKQMQWHGEYNNFLGLALGLTYRF